MDFFVRFTYKKMPTGHLFWNLNIVSRNLSRNECGEYVRGKEVKAGEIKSALDAIAL